MEKQVTAQELYNKFYSEACYRARMKGHPKPNEVEVFRILVKESRKAVADGEAPIDFLYELEEVKPQVALEFEAARVAEDRERGLREGTLTDIEDVFQHLGISAPKKDDNSNEPKK
jgi:hypothetical protein